MLPTMQTGPPVSRFMQHSSYKRSPLPSRQHQVHGFANLALSGKTPFKSQTASLFKNCQLDAVSATSQAETKQLVQQAQTQSCLPFGKQALWEVERAGEFTNMQQRCTRAEAEVTRLSRGIQEKDAQLQQKNEVLHRYQASLAQQRRALAQQSEARYAEQSELKLALLKKSLRATELEQSYRTEMERNTDLAADQVSLRVDLEIASEQVAEMEEKMAESIREAVEKAEHDMQEKHAGEILLLNAKMVCKDTEIARLRLDKLGRGVKQITDPTTSISGQAGAGSAGPLEKRILKTVMTKSPQVEWEQIAGLEDAKAQLQESVVLPLVAPGVFARPLNLWSGILLYGPPGTGKTFLAEAAATAAGSTFLKVSVSDLTCKWVGESEALVRTLFKMAQQKAPSVIFIDEVESLCKSRGSESRSVSDGIITELLVCMHDLQQSNRDGPQVVVLAATNRPQDIDVAIRRRFQKRFHVPLPDASARCSMLQKGLRSHVPSLTDADIQYFAEQTGGMSGSDMANLVNTIYHAGVRDVNTATHFRQSEQEGEEVMVPCSEDEPGAIQATAWELVRQGKGKALRRGPPSRQTAFDKLSTARPSLGGDALRDCQTFDAAFGSH